MPSSKRRTAAAVVGYHSGAVDRRCLSCLLIIHHPHSAVLTLCCASSWTPNNQPQPRNHQQQASAAHLKEHTLISVRQPDLPMWLLKQCWQDVSGKNQQAQQAQLLAARAAAGDLEGCQWLRQQGCAWTSLSCIRAAETGQVAVLKWLILSRPKSVPLGADAGTAALAAANAGQLPVLEFLHSELLLRPFDLAACAEAAAAAGHSAVLDFLVQQDSSSQLQAAAASLARVDQAAAAATRQQVQQIMRFARHRTPPAVSVRA